MLTHIPSKDLEGQVQMSISQASGSAALGGTGRNCLLPPSLCPQAACLLFPSPSSTFSHEELEEHTCDIQSACTSSLHIPCIQLKERKHRLELGRWPAQIAHENSGALGYQKNDLEGRGLPVGSTDFFFLSVELEVLELNMGPSSVLLPSAPFIQPASI